MNMATLVSPALLLCLCFAASQPGEAKPNVLFLVSDDMRPEIGAYYEPGSWMYPDMHTPNLDALASESLLLKRAYVQHAICNPSRSSLLTGRRPETTRVYSNNLYFRDVGGNFTTIPQYFKENGYLSIGMGKIYHSESVTGYDPPSWSDIDDYYEAPNRDYWGSTNTSYLAVPPEDREKLPLPDEQLADHAIDVLRQLADGGISGEQPFFMAVGFDKPHMPFTFPEEFLELYPMEDIYIAENPHAPVDMPDVAWSDWSEMRRYQNIAELNLSREVNTSMPDDVALDMRRAYYSSITYIDTLIGKILTEVKELGLDNNTIISFFGDHGWQLGEHSEWCKHTNFEMATNAPLMVHIPGLTDEGIVSNELIEFVDIYPTLVEAAGLPMPPLCPENSSDILVCREGNSMMPLIVSPGEVEWKESVFSQVRRSDGDAMGFSMRTDRYRYTEWPGFDTDENIPDWDNLHGVELYDHDGPHKENVNLAYDPAYADVVEELQKDLHAGWREQAVALEKNT